MEKITFILASLNVGGVEKNTLRLIKGFLDRGYKVDLLLLKNEGIYKAQLDNRVNLINLNRKKISHSIFVISKYFRENKPYALISAKDYINSFVIIARLLSGEKTRIITSTRTQVSVELSNLKTCTMLIYKILIRLTYPFATHLVAVSKGVAEDLARITGINSDKIHVIYNPIIDGEINEKKDFMINDLKNKAESILVSAGRLALQKDYPTLIKAIKIVREKKDIKLIILGDGEQRSQIEELIHKLGLDDTVFLKGNVLNPYPYMKEADLFVLSSKWEGFGNVIVEALAVGTPIVSTDCPSGPNEILDDGKYGVLVPVGNPKLLAEGIIKGLEREWNKNDLVKRANEFSVDRALDSYIRLINS